MKYANKTPVPFCKCILALFIASASAESLADMVLEEVIVTAQKRLELLQDVSATVNVVTGESIKKFATFSFNELEQQTAGLSLTSPNARNNTVGLRGVAVDPETGQSTAVDVYWNDAVVLPDIAFTQLYDLQRVENLRGPQGTLQGRTSPSGAINIITNRANVSERNGYIQVSAADNAAFNLSHRDTEDPPASTCRTRSETFASRITTG